MGILYKINYLSFFLILLSFVGKVGAQVSIKGVRANHLPDKQQVVIDVDNKASFYAFSLDNPPRIVVDIDVERAKDFPHRVSLDSSRVIQTLRTGIRSATTVRLVIDLLESVRWEAYAMQPDDQRGHRVVIDVYNSKHASVDLTERVDLISQQGSQRMVPEVTSPPLKSSTVFQPESAVTVESITEPEVVVKRSVNYSETSEASKKTHGSTQKRSFFRRVVGLFKGDEAELSETPVDLSQQSVSVDGVNRDEPGLPVNLPTSNQLYRFRVNRQAEKMQFVLDLQLAPTFKAFELDNPKRIVVDVAAKTQDPYQDLVGTTSYRGVLQVRSGIRSESVRRLVFDLPDKYQWEVSRLLPDKRRGHRLVIDIYDQAIPDSAPEPFAGDKRTPDQTLALTVQEAEMNTPPVIEISSAGPVPVVLPAGSTIDLVSDDESVIAPELITVLIDPGHGGRDSGAIGMAGTQEKEVTLDIARRLKQKLDGVYGMRVILTRYQDEYLSLPRRTQIARQYKADLFVSIHADAFIQPQVSGSSAYVLSEEGSSETAKWLAKTENAVDETYGIGIEKYDDIGQVLFDIQQDATIESSYMVAKEILTALKAVGKLHKHQVERANFSVLRSPGIPSVLVETAFISNPDEEQKLRRVKYREKVAQALAKGIKQYFKNHLPHHFKLINGAPKDYPVVDH